MSTGGTRPGSGQDSIRLTSASTDTGKPSVLVKAPSGQKAYHDQFWRTRMCPFLAAGHCRKTAEDCNFAHDPSLIVSGPSLAKTRLCEAWKKYGKCGNATCRFAHGQEELRATPDYYKTSMCKFWMRGDGGCPLGDRCRHAHGEHELRQRRYRRTEHEKRTYRESTNAGMLLKKDTAHDIASRPMPDVSSSGNSIVAPPVPPSTPSSPSNPLPDPAVPLPLPLPHSQSHSPAVLAPAVYSPQWQPSHQVAAMVLVPIVVQTSASFSAPTVQLPVVSAGSGVGQEQAGSGGTTSYLKMLDSISPDDILRAIRENSNYSD
ncbi:unnamed protein product [Vitrella brassicaformis CCMP3155]|uniref:C3H1-type domain-containing protein n=2 Tax=Vitrella brassicaformis TaxID=1169539 RepID=A0A0G4EAP0_VITBC|nr:unnamed protein product [Vitrella brassicaformis CCMP3155]|eukprot:CEL92338.1 unnamed protein product [Vitrella brassicaformis CCMP3155]